LPYIKKQELADAMAALAIAQFEGGDKKAGREAFAELLTWRPDYVYDAQKLPPKYSSDFEEAQRQVERAKRAPIAIHSTPEGAQAPGDKIAVDAWLYDLRNRHRLSKVHEAVPAAGAEAALASLPGTLYHGVSYEGELTAPEEKVPTYQGPKPFYKRWWFWTAV